MTKSLKNKGLQFYMPLVTMADYIGRLILPKKPHIFIACMPKSASTFLAHGLEEYGGLRRARLVSSWGRREQELDELRLSRYNHYAYVSQHHTRNSDWAQELIRRYHLTPVILMRNIFDIVISLRDHIRKDDIEMPFAYFDEMHRALPDEQLEQMIVDLAMPWFINFYMGWRDDKNAIFIQYEDMIANPERVMTQILEAANVKVDENKIAEAIEKNQAKQNRFNKGVAGRGKDLKLETRNQILRYISYYPDIQNDEYIKSIKSA